MNLPEELRNAIISASEVETSAAITYISEGGTYLIASPGLWNDDGKPRDLIAIGYFGDVIALSPTVNPDFIEAVKELVK